jgi:glutaredoxin-like protein NrdH
MEVHKVEGRNAGEIFLYALSTCGWCRKTKNLLRELGVAFSYVDVDLLDDEDQRKVEEEVRRWNPPCTFPTIVVNGSSCIVGYDETKIREAAGR